MYAVAASPKRWKGPQFYCWAPLPLCNLTPHATTACARLRGLNLCLCSLSPALAGSLSLLTGSSATTRRNTPAQQPPVLQLRALHLAHLRCPFPRMRRNLIVGIPVRDTRLLLCIVDVPNRRSAPCRSCPTCRPSAPLVSTPLSSDSWSLSVLPANARPSETLLLQRRWSVWLPRQTVASCVISSGALLPRLGARGLNANCLFRALPPSPSSACA